MEVRQEQHPRLRIGLGVDLSSTHSRYLELALAKNHRHSIWPHKLTKSRINSWQSCFHFQSVSFVLKTWARHLLNSPCWHTNHSRGVCLKASDANLSHSPSRLEAHSQGICQDVPHQKAAESI
jgi:hypothetical protein